MGSAHCRGEGACRAERGERNIVRRPVARKGRPPCQRGHRVRQIQLIDATGTVGVVPSPMASPARWKPRSEIAPNSEPPVCKILDYGKNTRRRKGRRGAQEAAHRSKEIKMRPNIDIHDYDAEDALDPPLLRGGRRLRLPCASGAEMAHQELGASCSTASRVSTIAKVEFVGAQARGPANGHGAAPR